MSGDMSVRTWMILVWGGICVVTLLHVAFGAGDVGAQSACHTIQPGVTVPAGYGAPFSFFGSTQLLVRSLDCNRQRVMVRVGDGDAGTQVYRTGYYWNGMNWMPVRFSGSQQTEQWATASADGMFPMLGNRMWFVAFTCQRVSGSWKCGCANAACTESFWQVQGLYIGGDDGGGGGGGGTCNNNGVCEAGETQASCPADCGGGSGPSCGNRICEAGETQASCPQDCSAVDGTPPPIPTGSIFSDSKWIQGNGRIIYVAPNGSATGNGETEENPVNMARARIIVQPGDTALFLPGNYGSTGLSIIRGGTEAAPVFYKAKYPAVVVNGGAVTFQPMSFRAIMNGRVNVEPPYVVVDGFDLNGGLTLNQTQYVLVRRNHFIKTTDGDGNNIQLSSQGGGFIGMFSNYFSRTGAAIKPGGNPGDYAIAFFGGVNTEVQNNLFVGAWNHAISTKEFGGPTYIAGNTFRGCGTGACLDLGQNQDGFYCPNRDHTTESVIVRNNHFIFTPEYKVCSSAVCTAEENMDGQAMKFGNLTYALVENNTMSDGYGRPIIVGGAYPGGFTRYPYENANCANLAASLGAPGGKVLGQFPPKMTGDVVIRNNSFGGGNLLFEGRGNGPNERVVLQNNTGTIRTCINRDMPNLNWSPSIWVSSRQKATLVASGNSFTCNP